MKKFFLLFKNRIFLRRFAIVVVLVLLIAGYIFYQKTRDRVQIDDSLISAPVIVISPMTSGTLTQMNITEGQTVKRGDSLAVVGSETIRTDTDGLVIMASNQLGSIVNPQTQLIELVRPVDLRVAGTVDENKGLNMIAVGQVVSFTVDAFPGKTYWGYVDEISPSAKQSQISFSISSERPTQQFVVYARFNSLQYPEIKNGMSAKMTVYTRTTQ